MRLSTADFYRSSISGMLNRQTDVGQLQVQLSSGKRIQSGADDPTASARIQQIRLQLNRLQGWQDNIASVRNDLQQQADLMGDIEGVLSRVRESVIAANNGSRSARDLQSYAAVVRSSRDELLALANSRDDQGQYIFAGFATNTEPFQRQADDSIRYQGDQGERLIAVTANQVMRVSTSGYALFEAINNGNGDFVSTASINNAGSGVIQVGEVRDRVAWDKANYRIEMGVRTAVSGGSLEFTDTNNNDSLDYSYSINGVLIETLVEGDSRTQSQIQVAINAKTVDTGVQAVISDGVLFLNSASTDREIIVSEQFSGGSDGGDKVTGFFGAELNSTKPAQDRVFAKTADSWFVRDENNATIASGEYLDGSAIQFAGVQTRITGSPLTGDRFDVRASSQQDLFYTLDYLASALESAAGRVSGGEDAAILENDLNRALAELEQGQQAIALETTITGGRLQRLDHAEAGNTAQDTRLQTVLSGLEDLDFTVAASQLSQQLVALQAAQQSFVRIQGLNLFDLL